MLDNNDRNFWSEVKRISGNKAGIINFVGGLTESDSIAKLFVVKYRELYISVPCNKTDMHDIVSSLNTALVDSPITSDSIIYFSNVKAAVSRLKPHKREGCSEYLLIIIINASDDCLIHIACLFSAIIVHGADPDSFGICTIVLIYPKEQTLSSVFGKVFNNIILERYHQ